MLRVVAIISPLAPLLLLWLIAWQMWGQEMSELDARVTSTLSMLAEGAQKVFENQELALELIEDRTGSLSWRQIGTSQDFFRFARTLADKSNYVDTIFLADAQGIVRATTSEFPVDRTVSVADRDYFRAAQREPSGLHIGEPVKGRLHGSFAFRVARRRSAADGSFDGVMVVAFSPTYFGKLFADVGGAPGDLLCLLRSDGKVLASNLADPSKLHAAEHPCVKIARAAHGARNMVVASADGITRLVGTRQLRRYPVVLSYAVDVASVRSEWLQDLVLIAVSAIVSSAVLLALSMAALRGVRRERQAIGAWQEEVKQRERVEAQMRHASKIELLGRMVSGVAHHFNNLLPALSGLLEMTLREVDHESTAARRLNRMVNAVAQARRLVRNILLFSRRPVSIRERVVVAVLIEETLALMQPSLPANVTVATRLSFDGVVTADRGGLQEVVMNLVSNAVHAIGARSGIINIVTERATVDEEHWPRLGVRPGDYVRVVFRDEGGGMTGDVLKHVFDPFFTTKKGAEGTGLGLAIVRGIVTDLGGAVHVESELGAGSTFTLYLPLSDAA